MNHMIKKAVGEKMGFTGGAEPTPIVSVERYNCPGSINHGDKTLRIEQDGKEILLSPKTMQAILDWSKQE